jgi:hypothetical protein
MKEWVSLKIIYPSLIHPENLFDIFRVSSGLIRADNLPRALHSVSYALINIMRHRVKYLCILAVAIVFYPFSDLQAEPSSDIKAALNSLLAGCNLAYKYQLEDARYFIGFKGTDESPDIIVSLNNLKGYKTEIPILVSIKKFDSSNFLIQKVIITQEELISPAEKECYSAGKSTYLEQFVNKNTGDEFKIRKDLDAITGASPTSWFIAHTVQIQAKHIEQIYDDKELLKEALENKKDIKLLNIN